jgi:hypothetical protein
MKRKCFNCGYEHPVQLNAAGRKRTGHADVCLNCLTYWLEHGAWPEKKKEKEEKS